MNSILSRLKTNAFKKRPISILFALSLLFIGLGIYTKLRNSKVFWVQDATAAVSVPVSSANSLTAVQTEIPKPSDWVDYGHVLEAGPEGAWDLWWAGATPASVVKKDGAYYFYYVASDGYRSHDGGPRHRAIGVATGQDGIHFTKHTGNPIMTHAPFNGEEEGANSAGITLDTNGDFVMYYGAAIGPGSSINADGRVAVSSDGFVYSDEGMVLDHTDASLYGYGDEIFPLAAFEHNGNWYVYYGPNGGTASGTLGMAGGSRFDHIPNSVKVLDGTSGGEPVGIWGNVIWLANDRIALFIQRRRWPNAFVEVRTASPDAPHLVSEPLERYDIPNLKRGTVFLDNERRTWFMYYNDFDRFWDVKLAPAGEPDLTPPAAPTGLSATALRHDQAELSWETAIDPDTGVVAYDVYRNGTKVGSTKERSFTDIGLSELSVYTYGVAAVNFHGTEGSIAQIPVTTTADITPPTLTSVTSDVDPSRVTVIFKEPVEDASAEDTANYAISHGIMVIGASLDADLRTVTLTTSAHADDLAYVLTVNDVLDRAAIPNRIASNTQAIYMHSSIAALAGCWNADAGTGTVAADVSGYGNDGLIYGAIWQRGVFSEALRFDGNDDYVLVDNSRSLKHVTNGSFTFAAWAKPEEVPPPTSAYGILMRSGAYPPNVFGLSYVSERRYQAQIVNSGESGFALTSHQLEPGIWHHVAMVVDDTAKQMHLYLDGEPVNGSPQSYSGALYDLNEETGENYDAGEYYIGSIKPDNGAGSFFTRHFKGLIDDARIYRLALTQAQVRSLTDLKCPPVILPPEMPIYLPLIIKGTASGEPSSGTWARGSYSS